MLLQQQKNKCTIAYNINLKNDRKIGRISIKPDKRFHDLKTMEGIS